MPEKNHKVYYLLLLMFSGMFVLRNVLGVGFPVVVFLPIVFIIALIIDSDEIIAFVLSFAAFSSGFQFKYGLLICLFVLLYKRGMRIKKNAVVSSILLVMVWELMHVFLSTIITPDFSDSIFEYLRQMCELFFLLVVVGTDDDREIDVVLCAKTIIYSTAVAGSIVLFKELRFNGYDLVLLSQRLNRLGSVINENSSYEFSINANGIGMMCNFAVSMFIVLLYIGKTKVHDLVVIGFTVLIGLLTVSRSFLIGLFLNIFVFVFLRRSQIKKKLFGIVIGVIGIFIAYAIINKYAPSIIDKLLLRFQSDDITNGRTDLLKEYNDYIWGSLKGMFWGTGMQNYSKKVSSITGLDLIAAHNGLQEVLIVWGVPGFLMFLNMLYRLVRKYWVSDIVYLLPFAILMILSMAGQLISSSGKLIYLVAIYIVFKYAYLSRQSKILNANVRLRND